MTIPRGDGSDLHTVPARIGRDRDIGRHRRHVMLSIRQYIWSGWGRGGRRILPAARRTMTRWDEWILRGRLIPVEIATERMLVHRGRLTVNRDVITTACLS